MHTCPPLCLLYYTTLYQIMTLQLLWLIEISSAEYSTYVSFCRSALSSTLQFVQTNISLFYQCRNYLSIHICQKHLTVIVVFFSSKNYFQNISHYYLAIPKNKKKYISQDIISGNGTDIAISSDILRSYTFYISIFLLSFMPSGSSVLRRCCSTGSFHRFPYVYPSQGFFPGLFL